MTFSQFLVVLCTQESPRPLNRPPHSMSSAPGFPRPRSPQPPTCLATSPSAAAHSVRQSIKPWDVPASAPVQHKFKDVFFVSPVLCKYCPPVCYDYGILHLIKAILQGGTLILDDFNPL
ncbi:unnamed protein product [Cyprideis torosa]|uniref:Uncharacterized protein n=1 Tax=Cyprideis torosa TaxID=163714 RepID=A0A7R8W5J0_9CRUS|nr:unnamed protein product [Cyprideis torosa]CAG0880467.1 unnamed protein product [Cyprideis torosa]